MRVVNSEPVDITQFAQKNGKSLNRVMLNPNSPLYVKMKWDKSDGGIFRTFLIDPTTYTAYGKNHDELVEFNFNDPYEKQSLGQVKEYLKGMQLDATLWGFLKKYWPNEDFGPKPGEAASQSQVADSRPNPTDGSSHVGQQGTDSRRSEAPSQARPVGRDGRPLLGSLGGNPPGTRSVSSNPSSSASSSTSSSSSSGSGASGKAQVVVKVFKMSPYRDQCGACDRLEDNKSHIRGYDLINWSVGGSPPWPNTQITVEKDGKILSRDSVVGNAPNIINQKIVDARAIANRN